MNYQNTQKLLKDFPDLFDKHPERPISLWGFECRDGWFDIIYSLSKTIYDLREKARGNEGQTNVVHLRARGNKVKVVQVKQKMGRLCFYMEGSTEEMSALAHLADKEASQTCELCGMKGETKRGAVRKWYMTLCPVHRELEDRRNG